MTLIGDKDWKPEYPVVAWENGIIYEENGDYIRDYWITGRVCKICNNPFMRIEFPPIFNNNLDTLLGKTVCLNCGYAFLERNLSEIMDSRKLHNELFTSLR